MSTQQTLLRVQTNVQPDLTISGTTNLSLTWQGGGIVYGGNGSQYTPFTGYSTSSVSDDFIIIIENNGSSGTLFYKFNLANYTGISNNFYTEYYFSVFYNNETPAKFIEYAVSDIDSPDNTLKINNGDFVSFRCEINDVVSGSTFSIYFVPDNQIENPILSYDFLDIYNSIPIKINKSFAELQDISKRNSDYSVNIQLPGSKKNNRFFQNFYNVDSSSLYFNPNKRVPCDVLIDDESYFNGYLRLNKINVLDSKIEYDVTLYSSVGDLFGKIGNNLLKDLNFNDIDYHFNHYFTLYNVTEGWQGSLLLNNTEQPPLWFYPVIHNGYLYSGDTTNLSGGTVASQSRLYTSTNVGAYVNYAAFVASGGTEYRINSPVNTVLDNQLKPGLSVYNLIELMFKNYGYSIKSTFFNTPWFKTLYTYGYFSSDTTKFGYKTQTPQTLPIEDVEILFVETFIDQYVTCSGSPYIQTTRTYNIYVVKSGTGIPCLTSGVININLKFSLFKCGGGVGTPYTKDITIPANSTGTTYSWISNGPYPIQPGISTGCTTCEFEYQQNFVDLTTSNVGVSTQALSYTPQPPGTVVNFQEYDFVNFNLVIDEKIKQIDFLSSIAKKFNLIFTPNPTNPSEIIIEPYDFYIGSGNIYDWSDKISYDKGWSVEPALNYVESELILTDLDDGDDGNKQFKDKNNRLYGEMYQYNATDFKSQQKKIDTIFSPEIIRKWDNNIGIPLGINYVASSQENTTTNRVEYQYKGIKTKPKLLFNLGNFSPFLDQAGESYDFGSGVGIFTMFFRLNQSDGTNPLSGTTALIYATNPSISHTIPMGNPDSNKINDDSLCILFNSELPIDIGLGQPTYNAYTENDMYSVFYSNRVNNLFNKTTRFLTGNFYLNLSDIKNLNPNDIIKINDQYFTWNKIDGFNLTNTELTKVELIQFNNSIRTYPTRYFKYNYPNDPNNYVYKFKTYFNPLDNPNNSGNSLRNTYYYWSVFYDYMVGTLGGNVSGFTSSYNGFFGMSGQKRTVFNINEITEDEYNSISLTNFNDSKNFDFINKFNDDLSLYINEQNRMIWVFSNQVGHDNAFLNVASDYSTFTGLCATNYVTISSAPSPNLPPTPTPTPTPSPTPLPTPIRGSLIFTFDQNPNYKGIDNYTITVNGQPRVLNYNNNDNLYTTYIYSGDSVTITISPELNDFSVYRRDYTTDDQGGDMGIRDVFITGNTGTYSISFNVTTSSIDYNFEYRVSGTTYTGVTFNLLTEDVKDILAEDNDELITEQNII